MALEDYTSKAQKSRDEASECGCEGRETTPALDDTDDDAAPDENGIIPILEFNDLWKKYSYETTLTGDLIVTNENNQMEIVSAFRNAMEDAESELGKDWFGEIPSEAYLTLGDVHKIKTKGLSLPVLKPQSYSAIEVLDATDYMFHAGDYDGEIAKSPYGLFYTAYRIGHPKYVDPSRLKRYPVDPDHFERVAASGSGADFWLKLHPSLLQHARSWKVWEDRF